MVDIDLDALQKSLEAAGVPTEKLTQGLKNAKDAAEKFASVSFNSISNVLGDVSNRIKTTGVNAKDLRTATDNNTTSFDTLAKSLGTLLALTTRFDAFKGLQVQGGTVVETMGSQFDGLITRFGGWTQASQKLAGAGLSSIVNMGEQGARAFLESASSAQQLETSYINLQASTGQLSNVFTTQNELTGTLSGQVARYGAQLADTAAITHENIKVVTDFSAKLGTIPNILNTLIDTGRGTENQLDGLATSMTLAKGAGRDLNDVYAVMKTAYEDLGNAQGAVTDNAKKGAEMFSLMSEASSKLGLRFEDTQGYLAHVADQFKLIGDNTQGATNILTRFTGALQNTGLTAKSSIAVVQGMVDSIKNLEMGTKALISARSGGPGGLQGAFKVENLLREGKTDQVAAMLEKSFKQQAGGKIYTQKEAEQSPQAAAQFMRQREMLKSGAFGSMAKDNDSATRLLEAMAAGPVQLKEEMKNAADATKSLAEKGNTLQENQINLLDMLNNSLDRSVIIQEQTFLAQARDAVGTGSKGSHWAEALEEFRNSSRKDSFSNFSSANVKEPLTVASQTTRQNRMASADLISSSGVLNQITGITTPIMNNVKNTAKEAVDFLKESAKRGADEKQLAADQARTAKMALNKNIPVSQAGMQVAAQRAMRQTPTTLQVPKTTDMVKHNVTVAPLEININVDSKDPVKVTTNQPDNTVVKTSNSAATRGGITESLR